MSCSRRPSGRWGSFTWGASSRHGGSSTAPLPAIRDSQFDRSPHGEQRVRCPQEGLPMKPSGIVLALVIACGRAAAQDSLDERIKELAGKLAKDGVSGRLADVAVTDPGLQAVHEKIDFLLST